MQKSNNWGFIIILFFLFPPLGVFLLFKQYTHNNTVSFLGCFGLFGAFALVGIIGGSVILMNEAKTIDHSKAYACTYSVTNWNTCTSQSFYISFPPNWHTVDNTSNGIDFASDKAALESNPPQYLIDLSITGPWEPDGYVSRTGITTTAKDIASENGGAQIIVSGHSAYLKQGNYTSGPSYSVNIINGLYVYQLTAAYFTNNRLEYGVTPNVLKADFFQMLNSIKF